MRSSPGMSEPQAVAREVEEVVPGVRRWAVEDERIGGHTSASYAVAAGGGAVLIDPLPLERKALAGLGQVTAIVVSCGSHQRSSWRLRRELGAEVWAPTLSREIEEEPDYRYGDGDRLPGDLEAIFTPGAGTTQHTLLLERHGGVVFIPDLLVQPRDGGEPSFVDDRYLHDPEGARRSVRRVLDLPFAVACLSHGPAFVENAKATIRGVLERDGSL